jgi:endonuclease III
MRYKQRSVPIRRVKKPVTSSRRSPSERETVSRAVKVDKPDTSGGATFPRAAKADAARAGKARAATLSRVPKADKADGATFSRAVKADGATFSRAAKADVAIASRAVKADGATFSRAAKAEAATAEKAGGATFSRAEKAKRIAGILEELFPSPSIPLDHQDPFQLLVAVVLSAQTTDARVNLVTPALFARAPDARAMAELSEAEILSFIKTCGLAPGKAKNLRALSRILVDKHGGEVPRTFEELEELPGVGHKSASVVMVQSFGVPAFPVDTHIWRLAGRWGLSRAKNVEEVERDLKAAFPRDRWHDLHLQIIYFGRTHCPALRHEPAACPICSWAMSKARARREKMAKSRA